MAGKREHAPARYLGFSLLTKARLGRLSPRWGVVACPIALEFFVPRLRLACALTSNESGTPRVMFMSRSSRATRRDELLSPGITVFLALREVLPSGLLISPSAINRSPDLPPINGTRPQAPARVEETTLLGVCESWDKGEKKVGLFRSVGEWACVEKRPSPQ